MCCVSLVDELALVEMVSDCGFGDAYIYIGKGRDAMEVYIYYQLIIIIVQLVNTCQGPCLGVGLRPKEGPTHRGIL